MLEIIGWITIAVIAIVIVDSVYQNTKKHEGWDG